MKLVVIQPVLPSYDCDFFRALQQSLPEVELVVLADIETKSMLNQYDAENSGFKVQNLPSINFFGLLFRLHLLRALSQYSNAIVIFNGNPRDVSQLLGMALLRLAGRKVYVWGMFHRIGGPRFISNLYYRLVGKLAHTCLCYSRVGASNLVSLGVPPSHVGVVGTAINEKIPEAVRLSVSAAALASFRKSSGLQGKHLVLQVVRLSRYKRPELLIGAANLLLAKRKDLVFVLIGGGDMLEELQHMVVVNGLKDFFRFLGPIYDEKILANWYMSARAFVVPTCIGLSLHHAMAYGVPVITDDSLDKQASEFSVLSDGINGLTYREGNVESLASKIEMVIEDENLRTRLSTNALITINEIHTIKAKVENFKSLILLDSTK